MNFIIICKYVVNILEYNVNDKTILLTLYKEN